MKKHVVVMAVIFCIMLLASCSTRRTYAPYALSTVSTVSLPQLQHSLERKDYEILNTIKAEAVVKATSRGNSLVIEAESGEFTNVCNSTENGLVYNVGNSKGTLRYGFIEGLNIVELDECSGNSMASYLAAYRLINDVKASGADGIVAPSLYVTAEETGESFFSRTITYKVEISAKLIKLNSSN